MRHCAMKIMVIALAVAVLASQISCRKTPTMSAKPLPAQFNGIAATIAAPNGTAISEKPIRLQYTLTNTTGRPVTLYAVERAVAPEIEGEGGVVGQGLTGATTTMALAPGASKSWWVEVSATKPARRAALIYVHPEGSIGYTITLRNTHAVSMRMVFSSGMFWSLPALPVYGPVNGPAGNGKIVSWTGAPTTEVMATPWIELTVK
jgi:hypothetical protein